MKIITISREFGSGGRELGKRLADTLNFDYYDREIITAIAGSQGLSEGYVSAALENHGWRNVPLTFRRSFSAPSPQQSAHTGLLVEQRRIIEAIARKGKDCVIVGRSADVLLKDRHPFNIFVCAAMEAKIRRCMERADPREKLSPQEAERNIRRIDKNRSQTREIITGSPWGHRSAYHLVVNTTDWNIRELTPAVAAFADCWFRRTTL